MSEESAGKYRKLFEIRVLHHYWLDTAGTIFDLMPKKDQAARLLSCDMRSVLDIAPTAATAKLLRSSGCLFRSTRLGCLAAAPEGAVVPADALLEFAVTMLDPAFFHYTALTLPPQGVAEIHFQGKKYRYKENVPVLSSLAGESRVLSGESTLFLSGAFREQTPEDRIESLVVSGDALLQLTSDPPGAETIEIGPDTAKLPVFLHQGDVPPIIPPAGLTGAPARGVLLSADLPDSVFAVIRLAARRDDDERFSLVDLNGHPKPEGPLFQIRFKNRSTVWRYLKKGTGEEIDDPDTPSTPLPLTHFGSAGSSKRPKPSPGNVKAEGGTTITRLVSEIFV